MLSQMGVGGHDQKPFYVSANIGCPIRLQSLDGLHKDKILGRTHKMRLTILASVLAEICCSDSDSIREYVENNFSNITTKQNLIGGGCTSQVYGFKFGNQSLALKHYHNPRSCKNEIEFFEWVSHLNLPVVPKTYFGSVDRGIIVMDRLEKTLKTYLQENSSNRDALSRLVNGLFDGLTVLHQRGIVHGNVHLRISWCGMARCSS
jgi:hypothetical protein